MTPVLRVRFDAHNHLQDEWLQPHLEQVAQDVVTARVAGVVVNGTCESDWPLVSALAARFPWVLPSFGLHPWDVGNASPAWREALHHQLEAHPRAALGEIGLDRWILERARPDDPRLAGLRRAPFAEQEEAFVWQLRLAAERNLPVSIHCLDAWGPLLATLRSSALPARGFLLHAYSGSAELSREFAALGAYFSFNGSFLGERHAARRAVFAALPTDRLLAETDAPALPPPKEYATHSLPPRADGTRLNHPANITGVYAGMAGLLGLPPDHLERLLAANFQRWFLDAG